MTQGKANESFISVNCNCAICPLETGRRAQIIINIDSAAGKANVMAKYFNKHVPRLLDEEFSKIHTLMMTKYAN